MILRWLDEALADIDNIFDHLFPKNPVAVGETLEEIFAAVRLLADPRLHHIGRPGRWAGTRELVLSNSYIVPYRVTDEAIEILAVKHALEDWPAAPPQQG